MTERAIANSNTRVLVPTGALGITFAEDAFRKGVNSAPDVICVDGGSTDSGPFYLGTGTSKYSRAVTKNEWRRLMLARAEAEVPLIIGSCGTCGTDSAVDWMLSITREIAEELGQDVKVAVLYSSQPTESVKTALREGRIAPLHPAPDVSERSLDECTNIVALAGAEQIGAALDTGADIVLAGRTSGRLAGCPAGCLSRNSGDENETNARDAHLRGKGTESRTDGETNGALLSQSLPHLSVDFTRICARATVHCKRQTCGPQPVTRAGFLFVPTSRCRN